MADPFRVTMLLKRRALECGPPWRAAALSSRELARGLAKLFSIQGLRYGQQAGRVESGSKLPHSKAHGARNIFRAKPHKE